MERVGSFDQTARNGIVKQSTRARTRMVTRDWFGGSPTKTMRGTRTHTMTTHRICRALKLYLSVDKKKNKLQTTPHHLRPPTLYDVWWSQVMGCGGVSEYG
jgi:hypothetical protein